MKKRIKSKEILKKENNKAKETVEKLKEELTFLKIIHPTTRVPKTLGQKASDLLTKWAGSWVFIILFILILIIWMVFNGYYWIQYKQGNPFDPYPFILLNLCLSCLAAIQAPIILMSQNRQVQKDRAQAQYDYAINRKSEREIQNIKKQLNRIEGKLSERK